MGFRQSQGKNKKSPRPAAAAAAQQAETRKRASKQGAERDTRPPTRRGGLRRLVGPSAEEEVRRS
jgi:hypothetical protein